ncbi:uncharacterized protein UV8b_01984 [Ustilaginoidea virens]|uniref:Amidase domain-containing protein n=1 Tax=Ustilaginoidea virens TaxID=1159556 RepID=A0A063C0I2_USTVR|nr:uncharacterized protein UV8b_01984 [Ustilaginoidea virens]QUC17743.1 hypothetical protein UV8b_01984 [Ustilaginoidea virens]GAO13945.1 hypothetical protein UVI_02035000 [Ustilaginoidea virens]
MIASTVVHLALAVACSLLSPGAQAAELDPASLPSLLDATLEELRRGLDSNLFTSVDLTKAYIARIKEVSEELRPVNEINPDALRIAARRDAQRKNPKKKLGPLHGIPVLIKDNIATLDKMNNTAGSYALLGAVPEKDSTVAAKLRRAGAIILGKSNMSQWANYRGFSSSNGWSSYGGQTKGAYFPDQDPSGSSSGSGVSSSLGLAWASLGTETDGSIISPASVNNLVGIKPSVGLTSRYLVVPLSEHQDTVGPMARSVKDAAYLLAAIAGADKKDNYTSAIPFTGKLPNYVAACKADGLRGKKLGVPRAIFPPAEAENVPIMEAFESALKILQEAGAELVQDIQMPGASEVNGPAYNVVIGADFATDVAKNYFAHLKANPANIQTLEQLQEFTRTHSAEEYSTRDTKLWQNALDLGFDNSSPEFWGNYTQQLYNAGPLGILGALTNHSLDALVLPADFMPSLPAIVGSPIITVPLGKQPAGTGVTKNRMGNLNTVAPNLPFGLAFAGARFSEETLIEIAYAFEQKSNVRQTIEPYVKPKTELKDIVEK